MAADIIVVEGIVVGVLGIQAGDSSLQLGLEGFEFAYDIPRVR
jgi:hypothetical protein